MKVDKLKSSRMQTIEMRRENKENNFSTQFNVSKKRYTSEELEEGLKDIKNTGSRLILTKNYTDITKYKRLIKDYLKNIVDNMYDMDKKQSFWEDKYFNTVKVVNEKLEELSNKLMSDEKENINIVADIDTIQGLLIDLYI